MSDTSTTSNQSTPSSPSAQPPASSASPSPSAPPQPQQTPLYSLTEAMHYFVTGTFNKNVADYQGYANRITGYKTLDRIQPFYPGLYCLGAISSLGKTTYAGQMADQLAAAGHWVLYFSLEQTPFELFSKSLARGFRRTNMIMAMKQNKPIDDFFSPSSIEIRRGVSAGCQHWLDQQIVNYIQAVENRMCVIHGAFSMTVEDIGYVTEEATKQIRMMPGAAPDEKPIVIIDYLQIIAPTLINGRVPDTRTSVDHIIHTLKAMQSAEDLTVFVISSLNRQNYLTPIDFESFKESGMIEYSCDVLMGLQLSVLDRDDFYHVHENNSKRPRETSLKEKREMINKAKSKTPRDIELVCLKNRYGISNFKLMFEYYPKCDYFRPCFTKGDPDEFAPDIVPTCIYQ